MRILPLPSRLLEEGPAEKVDLLIGGLGYELRSRRTPEVFKDAAGETLLLDLDSPGVGFYDENRRVAEEAGFELVALPPKQLDGWLLDLIRAIAENCEEPHVAIDVSSITRDRIARLIKAMQTLDDDDQLPVPKARVDFFYTPAKPPEKLVEPVRIEILGPVTPEFAGFAPDLDSPVVAFVGLGIEQDRAIGALEYIEPAKTWVFVPHGEDNSFDDKVQVANTWIWKTVEEKRRVKYQVDDPFSLYTTLEQLVSSESAAGRPILVPLGPKIFAVCCLLVAAVNSRAGVWRVSAGSHGKTDDCDSAGKLIGLRVELGADWRSG